MLRALKCKTSTISQDLITGNIPLVRLLNSVHAASTQVVQPVLRRPVLDRERFSDRDREREREWQKVPGTGINRERE